MKAILCTAYGSPDVLKLVELEKPAPGANDILVKVIASTVTFGDCEIRNLTLPAWTRIPVRIIMGYKKPKRHIPGMEFSGVVEALGTNVSTYKIGDAIFGSTGMKMGGNAEFVCLPSKSVLAIKPAGVSFEDATTIPVGGINALHFLRKANPKPGQKVLVIGAGGSIGSWTVLMAKYYGTEVTAIDHGDKLSMLTSIGADYVIDYTKEDFSDSPEKYDIIFDAVYKSSFSKCIKALTESGCYLMANTRPGRMMKGLWIEWTTKKKVVFALAAETKKDLAFLADLIATKKIHPVIDRTYALDQTIEAHRYVEKGLKQGSVIINVRLRSKGHLAYTPISRRIPGLKPQD